MGFDRPSDAGPVDNGAEAVLDGCQNCGKPSLDLVYVPGFNLMDCSECALEALAIDAAELSPWYCAGRFLAFQQASTVAEVAAVLAAHNRICPQCGGFQKQAAADAAEAA